MKATCQSVAYAEWRHPSNSANGFTENLHRTMNRDGDGQRDTFRQKATRKQGEKYGKKMNLGSG